MNPPTPATWRTIATAPRWSDPETSVWDGTEVLSFGVQSLNGPPYCRYDRHCVRPRDRHLADAPARARPPKVATTGGDRAVWTGTEVLLWGVTNTAYNPTTNHWRHLPDPPAGAGGPSVAVWTGTQMIGWGGGCCGGADGDGAAYTPRTNSWKLLPPSPLAPRHAMGTWTGTEMILAGGAGPDTDPPTIYKDAAAYDPRSRTWRQLAPMPVVPDRRHDGVGRVRGPRHRWWGARTTLPSSAASRMTPPRTDGGGSLRWRIRGSTMQWSGRAIRSSCGAVCERPLRLRSRATSGGRAARRPTGSPSTRPPTGGPRSRRRHSEPAPGPQLCGPEPASMIWGGFDARTMDATPMKSLLGGAALTPGST